MKQRIQFNGLFLSLFFFPFFGVAQNQHTSTDLERVLTSLRNKEKAWNAGDLNKFMNGYWKSDSLVFVGRNGPKYGYENTALNYKKSYPNRTQMGTLHFSVLYINQWDEKTIQLIGKYTLKRIQDQPSGFFTLLFRRINGEWKIVSDHSSAESE